MTNTERLMIALGLAIEELQHPGSLGAEVVPVCEDALRSAVAEFGTPAAIVAEAVRRGLTAQR